MSTNDAAGLAEWLGRGLDGRRGMSAEAFLAASGASDGPSLMAQVLRDALVRRDPVMVERAMLMLGRLAVDERSVEALGGLACAEWHDCQEDIVFALGELGDDRAVPILSRWAVELPAMLDEDDGNDLHSKAVHALVTLGSPAATAALDELRSGGGEAAELVAEIQDSRTER